MPSVDASHEVQQFVIVRQFRDMPNAFLFKSILDSATIDCFLADENTIRMDWLWSDFLGGIKLCVRATDVDTALSLLFQAVPEKFDIEGIGEYQQPRCPNCESLEVSFSGLNRAVDYMRALVGRSRPLHRSLWQCDSCGQQWPESDEKPPADFLTTTSSILLIFLTAQTFLVWVFGLIGALQSVAALRSAW